MSTSIISASSSWVLYAAQFNVGCGHKAFNAFNCNGKANDVFLAVFNYAQNFNGSRAFFAFSQFENVFPRSILLSADFGQTNEIVFGSAGDNLRFQLPLRRQH